MDILDSETGHSAKQTLESLRDARQRPYRFSTSGARSWSSFDSFSTVRDAPVYEPYIIYGSLGIFMLYFLVLREENDIDEKLSSSLYDRIEGLEEQTLLNNIRRGKQAGTDVSDLEARLKEIQTQKAKG